MGLLKFFAPPECPVCAAGVPAPGAACADCAAHLEADALTARGRCPRCFFENTRGAACDFCAGRPVWFDRHFSLYRCTARWRRTLHAWKFENDRQLWRLFAPRLLALAPTLTQLGVEAVFWIDSGASGRELRFYQPCADPARALAAALAVPARAGLRKIARDKQSGRSYLDRFRAVAGSLEAAFPARAAGLRRCAILEDVFTTGATANEAARILKKNGVATVTVVSLLLREEAFD